MDADNRVVINCGGIRHEVYKVDIISWLMVIVSIHFFLNFAKPIWQSRFLHLHFSPIKFDDTFPAKRLQKFCYLFSFLLGNSKEDPCHQVVKADRSSRQLRPSAKWIFLWQVGLARRQVSPEIPADFKFLLEYFKVFVRACQYSIIFNVPPHDWLGQEVFNGNIWYIGGSLVRGQRAVGRSLKYFCFVGKLLISWSGWNEKH